MVELGYWLSSEEHPPADLVRYARRAEELGFPFALISRASPFLAVVLPARTCFAASTGM